MVGKYISNAVIKRLPRYYRYLGDLLEMGIQGISSQKLSEIMHLTASQIRHDLNCFGGFGYYGYGYSIKKLYDEIGNILGIKQVHNIIIIGGGNLGCALAKYPELGKCGFRIVGIFDNNPNVIGKSIGNIMIKSIEEMDTFIINNKVDIATLTMPKDLVKSTVDNLMKQGIKAFWNFTQVDLEVGEDIIVENIHLSDSLLQLSYNLSIKQNKEFNSVKETKKSVSF